MREAKVVTKTATKERGILFSGPMVRAILDGRKTMTRRIARLVFDGDESGCGYEPRPCPYGRPGDRLIVRETWSPDHAAFYPHWPVVYRADEYPGDHLIENGMIYSPEAERNFPFKWRSPIHMPRRFARIVLEVIGVKVERVQAISEEDAAAEGCRDDGDEFQGFDDPHRKQFACLWASIHGPGSWESNPFVWVVSFRRVETP